MITRMKPCAKDPGGIADQKAYLEAEGHTVIKKGKHYAVTNLEKSAFDFGVGANN